MTEVRWTDWDGNGLEHCYFHHGKDGLTLEGAAIGTREGSYGGYYSVRTDAQFRTREVEVRYVGGPMLYLRGDGNGTWRDTLRDQALPDLEGCIDVDIGITPATNTLPILRLGLDIDESREIKAAYVPLLNQIEGVFLPRPADQRYTCLEPAKRYRYEGLFRGFTAELKVDAEGLVLDYPETFRRVDA